MKRLWRRLGALGLLVGLGVVLWQYPHLWLPGEIAMGHYDHGNGDRAIYLLKSGRFLGSCWRCITRVSMENAPGAVLDGWRVYEGYFSGNVYGNGKWVDGIDLARWVGAQKGYPYQEVP